MPDVTVVIPTRDRWDVLARTLAALDRQDLGGVEAEVVVVDNGSRDGSHVRLERERDTFGIPVKPIAEPRSGSAAARNAGVLAASAPLILFLGDDTVPASRDFLVGHVHAHEPRDVWRGVLGRAVWHPRLEQTPLMEWLERGNVLFDYRLARDGGCPAVFYASWISVQREALEAVDGFDERFPIPSGEDTEIGIRLFDHGFRIDFHPELLLYHDHTYELPSLLARIQTKGRGFALIQKLHGARPDLDSPNPSRAKIAAGRVIAPLVARAARHVGVPKWLPRPVRDKAFRVALRANMATGFAVQGSFPRDMSLRGGLRARRARALA
jgi:GT2 family glycosyltransferase